MLIFFKSIFFLGGVVPLLLGLFIFLKNRNDALTQTYFMMSLSSAIWSLGFFMLVSSNTLESALFWRWFMESGSIFIVSFWLHFICIFSGVAAQKKIQLGLFYLGSALLWTINFSDLFGSNLFAKEMVPKGIFNFYPTAGIGYTLFFLFFFTAVIYSFILLFTNLKRATGVKRSQTKFLIVASVLGFAGGGMTFLLTFNIPVTPYGVIFFAFYPVAIAYTVTKHRLFNIRVIATQLFVAALSIFVFVRAVIATDAQERIIDFILFIVTTVVGVFLIRSVIQEVKQREEIQHLAENLEKANVKLRQADKMKTKLMSIASHDLRSPLGAIKGYASMMTEGSFGKLSEGSKEAASKIFAVAERMNGIVEDFLNISRIEQGRLKYDFEEADLVKLAHERAKEQAPQAEEKGLELTFESSQPSFMVKMDVGKMEQIVNNLIDNAVKYTPKGSVHVSVEESGEDKVRLIVEDTGVGIPPEAKENLFKEFSRLEEGEKQNRGGTGLGLYIAKVMIEAHKGHIWAESEGEGKGSRFIIELPVSS